MESLHSKMKDKFKIQTNVMMKMKNRLTIYSFDDKFSCLKLVSLIVFYAVYMSSIEATI